MATQQEIAAQNAADYIKYFGQPAPGSAAYNYVQTNNPTLVKSAGASAVTGSPTGDTYLNDNTDVINNATFNSADPQRPGESYADYQQRILNTPFNLAGGGSNFGTGGYLSDRQILNNLIQNTTPTKQITLPQASPGGGTVNGVSGMLAYYKSLFDTSKSQMEDIKKQKEAAQNKQTSETAPYLKNLMEGQTPGQARTAAEAATGINPAQYFAQEKAQIAEIQAKTDEYNKAVAMRDQQIAQTQDKLASLNFINNQVAQINRNAAPVLNQLSAEINAKAAALQASQGMYAEAQKYVNQAVDAATSELKYNFDMYTQLYSMNQDVINRLDSKYQDAFKLAVSASEKAFTFAQDEKTKIGQLLLDNPQAGIDIYHDTLEQALAKVQKTPKTTGQTVGSAESGYSNIIRDSQGNVVSISPIINGTGSNAPVKLTSTQTNNGATLLGVTPDQFKQLDPQVQMYFASSYGKSFMGALADIKSGDSTYNDVKESIDNSVQPAQVKAYLQSLLDKVAPQSTDSGRAWYQKLGSFITGGGYK